MKNRLYLFLYIFSYLTLSCATKQILPETKKHKEYEKKFKKILVQLPKDSADIPYGIPIKNGIITSSFGQTNNLFTGKKYFADTIKIAQYPHVPVLSTANGIITKIDWIYGYVIKVKHKYNFETEYIGLYSAVVKVGQYVKKGTKIGTAGYIHSCAEGIYSRYRIFHNKIAVNPVLLNKNLRPTPDTN